MLAQQHIQPKRDVQPYVRPNIQPKLKVGRQDDAYERQANRAAETIAGEGKESGLQLVPPVSMEDDIRMMPMKEESQTPPITMDTDPSLRMYPEAKADNEERDAGFIEMHIGKAGSGKPLDGSTLALMEPAFGRSFENVRIHTDARAAAMAESIRARAFTLGQHIYFNRDEYRPETDEGKQLIAHELTHTVQQGDTGSRSVPDGVVQPSLFRRAASSIGSGLRRAAEWVGESLSEGLRWLRGRLGRMVSSLPGYGLFTVFLGRDPITGESVARNGRNFIHHGLDIIPNGAEYRQKLEQEGALDEAAAWIDDALAQLNLSASDIMGRFRQFWDSLSLSDVGNPSGVFDRLVSLFSDPVNRLIRFAVSLARKFLEIVKNYLLSQLRDWVENRESPTWYPLITVILGRDPIMNEEVERSGENILTGFIRLHPEGDEQLARMRETGSFQRAAEWIDESIARLSRIVSGLTSAVRNAWGRVTDIRSLLDPVGVFSNIWNEFSRPIADLAAFALEVAAMILRFVKDALLSRLSSFARDTWGYPLLTVLLGKDPFTQEVVERSPQNIIRGFILLLPGGEEKYSRLQESGAIDRMVNWIGGAVAALNITFEYIIGLFTGLWNSITIRDLATPLQVFARIVNTFAEPVQRILAFIWEVIKALVMFALEVMNFPFDTIRNIVNNAMQAYEDIKADPIGFFLNLLAAVKQGFVQFFNNFVDHLLGGLRTWLFGELRDAGISPPQDLSFRSILGFVLEILGITLSNIWARLAEKIGPERAQQIQSWIDRATGVWAFVKDVYERGPVAIWEYIQGRLSSLWDMITGYIRNWIVTQIIQRVMARLLSMLDPTGIMAVVNGFIAFYNAVQSFIEKLREMLEIVNSFVAGVANVARGVISQAANYLENALASGIPVAISFLANQVGLSGLGSRVAEMIEQARGYVNQAIDWLIDRALAAGSALLEMGRSALGSIRAWWQNRVTFTAADGHQHSIYFRGEDENAELVIASNETRFSDFVEQLEGNENLKSEALAVASQLDTAKADRIDRSQSEQQQQAAEEAKSNEIDRLLNDLRPKVQDLLNVTGTPPASFDREPPLGAMDSAGFGVSMRVTKLHHTNKAQGSGPTQAGHTVYDDLNLRRTPGGSNYYARGHVLSEYLGGPGSWDNMVPLSRSGNALHETRVESKVKTAFDAGAVVSYSLTLSSDKYDSGKNTLLQQIRQLNPDPVVVQQKEKIIEAEQFVVTEMTGTANVQIRSDNDEWEDRESIINSVKVTNAVERTPESYHVANEPRVQRINFNAETDFNKIKTATGLDDRVINALLSENPRPRFYRYAAIADELDISVTETNFLAESRYVYLGKGPSD